MSAADCKAARRKAKLDIRYRKRRRGVEGAAIAEQRKRRAAQKAIREGRSFGYNKK